MKQYLISQEIENQVGKFISSCVLLVLFVLGVACPTGAQNFLDINSYDDPIPVGPIDRFQQVQQFCDDNTAVFRDIAVGAGAEVGVCALALGIPGTCVVAGYFIGQSFDPSAFELGEVPCTVFPVGLTPAVFVLNERDFARVIAGQVASLPPGAQFQIGVPGHASPITVTVNPPAPPSSGG